MTPEQEQIWRAGFAMGVAAEQAKQTIASHVRSMGADGERPKLRLVATDEPTAELLHFPTNEKTAS